MQKGEGWAEQYQTCADGEVSWNPPSFHLSLCTAPDHYSLNDQFVYENMLKIKVANGVSYSILFSANYEVMERTLLGVFCVAVDWEVLLICDVSFLVLWTRSLQPHLGHIGFCPNHLIIGHSAFFLKCQCEFGWTYHEPSPQMLVVTSINRFTGSNTMDTRRSSIDEWHTGSVQKKKIVSQFLWQQCFLEERKKPSMMLRESSFSLLHLQLDPSTMREWRQSQGHELSPSASDLGIANHLVSSLSSKLPGGLAKKTVFVTAKTVKHHQPLCCDSQHLSPPAHSEPWCHLQWSNSGSSLYWECSLCEQLAYIPLPAFYL